MNELQKETTTGENIFFQVNEKKPHVCPVCWGKGIVPNNFYLTPGHEWTGQSLSPETCRSCGGSGIVWG
jgi:hypothetical protein